MVTNKKRIPPSESRFGKPTPIEQIKKAKEEAELPMSRVDPGRLGGGGGGAGRAPFELPTPAEQLAEAKRKAEEQKKQEEQQKQQQKAEEERTARIQRRTIAGQIEVQTKTFETLAERNKRLFEKTSTPLERQRYEDLLAGYRKEQEKAKKRKDYVYNPDKNLLGTGSLNAPVTNNNQQSDLFLGTGAVLTADTSNLKMEDRYRTNFGSSLFQASKNIVYNIGQTFQPSYKRQKSRNVFGEFDYAFGYPGEKKVKDPRPIYRGTEITGDVYSGFGTGKTITKEELAGIKLAEAKSKDPLAGLPINVAAEKISGRVSEDLYKKYQEKVNKGELTAASATKEFEKEYTKEFDKSLSSYQKASSGLISSSELYEARGGEKVKGVALTGTLLAFPLAGAVYSGTSFTKSFGLATTPRDIGFKQRAIYSGKAALDLSMVGGFTAATFNKLSRSNILDLSSDLGKTSFKFRDPRLSKELYKSKKGSLFSLYGERTAGESAKQSLLIKAPVFKTGKGRISLTGGSAKVKTEIYDFVSGKTFRTVEDLGLQGYARRQGSLAILGKGSTPLGSFKGKTFFGYGEKSRKSFVATTKDRFGNVRLSKRAGESYEITEFPLLGVSKKGGKYYEFIGGSPKQSRFDISTGKYSLKGDIQSYGIIKRYVKPKPKGIEFEIVEPPLTILKSSKGRPQSLINFERSLPNINVKKIVNKKDFSIKPTITSTKQIIKTKVDSSRAAILPGFIQESGSSGISSFRNVVPRTKPITSIKFNQPTSDTRLNYKVIDLPRQIIKEDLKPNLVVKPIVKNKEKVVSRNRPVYSFKQPLINLQSEGITTITKPKTRTQVKQKPELKSRQLFRNLPGYSFQPITPTTPVRDFGFRTFRGGLFALPPLPRFSFKRTKLPKQRKQITRYTPSLTGAFFNIKGKPTELGKLGYFGVRPVISRKKSKSKKKKK